MTDDSKTTSSALAGRVALVVDGGRGLGAAIALALGEAGADIALLAHESCEETAVAALLRRAGRRVLGVSALDYDDADEVAETIETARTYLGALIILVDLTGVPAALEALLPDMQMAGRGAIITAAPDRALPAAPGIARLAVDPLAPPEATAAQVREWCVRVVG